MRTMFLYPWVSEIIGQALPALEYELQDCFPELLNYEYSVSKNVEFPKIGSKPQFFPTFERVLGQNNTFPHSSRHSKLRTMLLYPWASEIIGQALPALEYELQDCFPELLNCEYSASKNVEFPKIGSNPQFLPKRLYARGHGKVFFYVKGLAKASFSIRSSIMNKSSRFFLGIDIGTTSVSAVLIDLKDGRNRLTRTQAHNAELPRDIPEANLQNPEILLSITKNLLDDVRIQHSQIDAIGITGQMHGIVPVNHVGKATGPAYTWLDGRAGQYMDSIESDLGTKIPGGYGAATLYSLLRTNSLDPRTVAVADIPGWVAAGIIHSKKMKTSASLAHSLGLFSMDNQQFNKDSWSRLGGIAAPEIVPSATFIGETDTGIPVCIPEGDNQACFIASISYPEISISLSVGTSSQISLVKPVKSRNKAPLMEERPLPGGQVLLVGAGLAGGKSFDPLISLVQEIAEKYGFGRIHPYTVLDKLQRPETNLSVDARFTGTRTDPSRTGAITGIDFNNFTLAHLYWGIANSIVDELLEMPGSYMSILDSADSYLVAAGNAVKKNTALQTLFADRTGKPVRQLRDAEATARGAAMLAAAAYDGGVEKLSAIQKQVVRY